MKVRHKDKEHPKKDKKDPIPNGLRSCVVYKFTCAGCNTCYIGETSRHYSTRVREHLKTDRASHIYKHLIAQKHVAQFAANTVFEIIDQASTCYDLKIKEALHACPLGKALAECPS